MKVIPVTARRYLKRKATKRDEVQGTNTNKSPKGMQTAVITKNRNMILRKLVFNIRGDIGPKNFLLNKIPKYEPYPLTVIPE